VSETTEFEQIEAMATVRGGLIEPVGATSKRERVVEGLVALNHLMPSLIPIA
jgi:hypothetical protein